jgi:hypothetical protein
MDYHRGLIGAMDPDAGSRPRQGLLVQRRLLSLYDRGFCSPEELDRRALDALADLSEEDAVATLNEFESADRHSIKNLNAFLVSIIHKYRRGPPLSVPGGVPGGMSLASLPPAPATMPVDLMYGFGDLEYVPEMPLQYVKQMQMLQQPPQHAIAPSQHHPRRPFSGEKPPPVALIPVPPSERVRFAQQLCDLNLSTHRRRDSSHMHSFSSAHAFSRPPSLTNRTNNAHELRCSMNTDSPRLCRISWSRS